MSEPHTHAHIRMSAYPHWQILNVVCSLVISIVSIVTMITGDVIVEGNFIKRTQGLPVLFCNFYVSLKLFQNFLKVF